MFNLLTLLVLLSVNFTVYGYLYTDCLFLDCLCDGSRIKCPRDTGVKFEFFPKRNQRTAKPAPSNITFDVSSNCLYQIPDDRFSDLDVDLANFSRNRIKEIYADAFLGIRRLKHLDLSHNFLHILQKNTFIPIRHSLLTLNLENNSLSLLDRNELSERLEKLTKLHTLNLASNKLSYIPDLYGINTLKNLSLESNLLESADLLFRRQLPNSLLSLNLNRNELKQIDQESFGHLKNLQYLNLAFNYISQISEDAFENLLKLVYLDLSNNCLKHIPSKIFYSLINLEYLDLSSQKTPIRQIDDYAFDRLSNEKFIGKINLKNNEIEAIENKAFCSRNFYRSYVNIKEIDLSENLLTSLNPCVVRQLYKGFNLFRGSSKTTLKLKQQQSRPLVRSSLFSKSANLTLLECNCELSRSSKYVDLIGDCSRKTVVGQNVTKLEHLQARLFECGELVNLIQVEKYCTTMSSLYECKVNDERFNDLTSKITTTMTTTTKTTTLKSKFKFSYFNNKSFSLKEESYFNNESLLLNDEQNSQSDNLTKFELLVRNNDLNLTILKSTTHATSNTANSSSSNSNSFSLLFYFICFFVFFFKCI